MIDADDARDLHGGYLDFAYTISRGSGHRSWLGARGELLFRGAPDVRQPGRRRLRPRRVGAVQAQRGRIRRLHQPRLRRRRRRLPRHRRHRPLPRGRRPARRGTRSPPSWRPPACRSACRSWPACSSTSARSADPSGALVFASSGLSYKTTRAASRRTRLARSSLISSVRRDCRGTPVALPCLRHLAPRSVSASRRGMASSHPHRYSVTGAGRHAAELILAVGLRWGPVAARRWQRGERSDRLRRRAGARSAAGAVRRRNGTARRARRPRRHRRPRPTMPRSRRSHPAEELKKLRSSSSASPTPSTASPRATSWRASSPLCRSRPSRHRHRDQAGQERQAHQMPLTASCRAQGQGEGRRRPQAADEAKERPRTARVASAPTASASSPARRSTQRTDGCR